jgi:hypothetical protein
MLLSHIVAKAIFRWVDPPCRFFFLLKALARLRIFFWGLAHSLEFVGAELLVNHLPDDFVRHDGRGGGGVR